MTYLHTLDANAIVERVHAHRTALAETYGDRRYDELRADPADVIADIDEADKDAAIWLMLLPAGHKLRDMQAAEKLVEKAINRVIDREIATGAHREAA